MKGINKKKMMMMMATTLTKGRFAVRHLLLVPALSVLSIGLPVATVRAQAPAPVELTKEMVELAGGTRLEADFGRIEVPENRAVKESRSIRLAFLRVPSPLATPGRPVFMLAGGPGGSSIDMVKMFLRGGGLPFLELMGGDIVAIDQRGVGRSEPNLESETLYGFPVGEPGRRDAFLEVMRAKGREEAKVWREKGVDLRGYTTVESADDVDAVRRTLGYDKIIPWGASYGSHLALATIRRHGAHVDRAVLIGPEGSDHTIKLPSYAQDALEKMAALVRKDAELGPRLPDLVGVLGTVLERLEAVPVFVEVDGERIGLSKFDVQRMLAWRIGTMRNSGDRIPALALEMADGDFTTMARWARDERRTSGVGSVMQVIMDSASGVSAGRRALIAEEAPKCLFGDTADFPFPWIGQAWGAPDLGEAFRGPLRSDIPVLILVGDLDARTPVRNAREIMAGLPNARLIVVRNAAHDLNWLQPELRAAWSAFLAGKHVELTEVQGPPPRFQPPIPRRSEDSGGR